MVITVFYGSTRDKRQGLRAALFLQTQLRERGHEVNLIDPLEKELPLLRKMYKEYRDEPAPEPLESIHNHLEASDGFVLVSAEYNHSIPPALKNVLDHFQKEYYFKPSLLVTYSAGPFGGIRVEPHLRAVTGELGMISIPSSLPISKVGQSFDEEGQALDEAYIRRADRVLTEFEWYLRAFKNERAEGTPY
ncbi:NAD(P)H-dependent oxidoreductase [Cryomorphaceae bacterium]|nr:NAD(P)H-dependent oxidoreductase [Cryomorphaceae bacterium]